MLEQLTCYPARHPHARRELGVRRRVQVSRPLGNAYVGPGTEEKEEEEGKEGEKEVRVNAQFVSP